MVSSPCADEKSVVIYFLRRDLRLEDNPIFHALATNPEHKFAYLLPVYIFPAQQVEVSGFIPLESQEKSPYPEARSNLGRFWRCGPHRAKFLSESVWALKESLQDVGSGLEIRVGIVQHALDSLLQGFQKHGNINIKAVWMTQMMGGDEKAEEKHCELACKEAGIDFKLWKDEKYLIDDDDVAKRFNDPQLIPDIFTTYRKMVEPLRDNAREVLPTPLKNSLPPLPPSDAIPPQPLPFVIPGNYEALEEAILLPITQSPSLDNPPLRPEPLNSAHVYHGGAKCAQERVDYLLKSGSMSNYKATRNGLLGLDFSTKLSAWLSLGCITARQVHADMYAFEEGTSSNPEYRAAAGWGQGENEGTKAVRFEFAWRDYMRLCHKKFEDRITSLGGFKEDFSYDWKRPGPDDPSIQIKLDRFLNGTTGMGLIDASQRELYFTGYTSNRARQNVASYLSKHLGIDWRLGAEWYENMLIDHDVSSNWGNWQYVAGVGNDPRSTSRIFNSVKQAVDYDPTGEYVYHWIAEFHKDRSGQPTVLVEHENRDDRKLLQLGKLNDEPCKVHIQDVFRGYTMYPEKRDRLGLTNTDWIVHPLIEIDYIPGRQTTKPGQRERWRSKQEQKDERQKNGGPKRNSQGKGYANHKDEDGNGNNGRGGPGGGAGGSAGGSPPSSHGHGGASGEGSASGNASRNHAGSGRDNHQRKQSNGQNGQQRQRGRGYSGSRGNASRGRNAGWENTSNLRSRSGFTNNRGADGQSMRGWVRVGPINGRHHMICPPPGIAPPASDAREMSANWAPRPLWGDPGPLPLALAATVAQNGGFQGIGAVATEITAEDHIHNPHGGRYGSASAPPQQWLGLQYVATPQPQYSNYGNAMAASPMPNLGSPDIVLAMPDAGYGGYGGGMGDLTGQMGRMEMNRGPMRGSWRQPS